MSAPDLWARARRDLNALTQETDFDAAAAAYVRAWPKHPPDFFKYTSRQRRGAGAQAFSDGSGWAARLLMSCPDIVHYTLDARALGLAEEHELSQGIFCPDTLKAWKSALKSNFTGPHRWKLELGDNGRVHAHVIADASACPASVKLGSERAKPCESYYQTLVGYLLKPGMSYTPSNVSVWLQARSRLHRLPQLSGVGNIPRSLPTEPSERAANHLRKLLGSTPSAGALNLPSTSITEASTSALLPSFFNPAYYRFSTPPP